MGQEKSRIVTKEEMERIGILPPGKAHWVRKKLHLLDVEQTFQVMRSDWNWAYKTPNVIVRDMNAKGPKQFKFWDAADDSGWFIQRVA